MKLSEIHIRDPFILTFENKYYLFGTPGKYSWEGVGGFFWRTILFAIPIVGLICCIVMAFAPRNPNVRNHARAYCIFWIIAAAILLTLVIIAAITGASLFSALSNGYY